MLACCTLVLMLCISYLDYSNALLYGITKKLLQKYQRIQNICAKLVLNKCKYDSATECLKQLHWLPIKQRIQHKLLVITHKALKSHAPKYIWELINVKQAPSKPLRSRSSGRLLYTPRIRKETFASRSFSYAALVLWKSLPRNLQDETFHYDIQKTSQNIYIYIYIIMHSTCKACEKVSHCILFTVLYQKLYYYYYLLLLLLLLLLLT